MLHALKTFYYRGAMNTRVNPDTIGCASTDGEIFESGKNNVVDSKISGYV